MRSATAQISSLHALGHGTDFLARRRRDVALRQVIEQPHAQRDLERVQPSEHGRGMDAEGACRLARAAGAGDRQHGPQVVPVEHGACIRDNAILM
jgi:hypothetical protein